MLLNPFGDILRVAMIRQGKMVVHFVAEYEAFIDGEHRPVVRYDCSHDRPHRDTLSWSGRGMPKRWIPEGPTRNQALTDAVDDIKGIRDGIATASYGGSREWP